MRARKRPHTTEPIRMRLAPARRPVAPGRRRTSSDSHRTSTTIAREAHAPSRVLAPLMPTLSSLLVQREAASMRSVEDAIARQVLHGGDLATNLLELAAVREDVLLGILAEG